MYFVTQSVFFLFVLFNFGAAEPPSHGHGYGPPSPVDFSNGDASDNEQYASFGDFSYSGSSPQFAKAGGYSAIQGAGASPSYKTSYPGSNGGVSSSYINVVHANGAGGSHKFRHPSYSTYAAAPKAVNKPYALGGFSSGNKASYINNEGAASEYSGFNPAGASYSSGGGAFRKGFGNSAVYSNADVGGYSSGQSEGYGNDFPSTYTKGYESGDEVGSYSSGGPTYTRYSGAAAYPEHAFPSRGSPSISGGHSFGSNAANSHSLVNSGILLGKGQGKYSVRGSGGGYTGRVVDPAAFSSRPLKTVIPSGYSSSGDASDYSGIGYSGGDNSPSSGVKVQSSYSTAY